MLVLCYRLNNPKMSKALSINSETLYRQAKEKSIAFYKFQNWIEKHLGKETMSILMSFTNVRRKDLKAQDLANKIEEQQNEQPSKKKQSRKAFLRSSYKDRNCLIF